MKQTTGKITSLALSLALALSLFAGMTAFADDPAAAPAAPSTPSASQNAANTAPSPANSAPTNSTGTSSGAPASGSASVSSSTPAVQAPFISNYSVDVHNDSQLFPGGKADITITVVEDQPGDTLSFGDQRYAVTAVGEKVAETFSTLGHCTVRFDGAAEPVLPGTVHVKGTYPSYQIGDRITIE